MASRSGLRSDAVVAIVAAALLALWDLSGADLAVVRWFGRGDGFAWRDAWLTSTVLHQGGRLLAWGLFAGLVLNVWRPWVAGPSRSERIQALIATTISLLSVSALKRVSHTSCPWDLAEFGGAARYVSHWSFGVLDGGAGHCFPSGHAVGAFAFVSGYFMLRGHRPGLARVWLAAVLCTGIAFGMAQLARGAHYPSHTFWSAWLCWVICAAFTAASQRAHRTAFVLRTPV
jgi:membrane-associated PAP2 superfamily phosphatase